MEGLKKSIGHYKKGETMERKIIYVAFLVFVVAAGFLTILFGPNAPESSMQEAIDDNCVLEYGEAKCIDGKLTVLFFNSGEKTIESAEVTIPTKRGQDIAGVNEPLAPDKPASLFLSPCETVDYSRNLKLKWCCGECYETEMTNPSEFIEEHGSIGTPPKTPDD